MYLLKKSVKQENVSIPQLMGSGTILREVEKAARLLEKDFKIYCDVWSVTSFSELRRESLETERWNELNPEKKRKSSYLEKLLSKQEGPFIAATDYMKMVPDQIQKWVPGIYKTLGTDGYGRSDSRAALREHFEVDARFIVLSTLNALVEKGDIEKRDVVKAIKKYKIDPKKISPEKL